MPGRITRGVAETIDQARPGAARGPIRLRHARQRGRRPDLVGHDHARQGAGAAVDHRQGGVVRHVLLPDAVSRSLLRGDAGANDAVFASRKTGARLGERAILGLVKRAAARRHRGAGVASLVTPPAREPCHRPRRDPTGSAGNPWARQHRDHQRLLARTAGVVERVEARPWDVSSMTTSSERSGHVNEPAGP